MKNYDLNYDALKIAGPGGMGSYAMEGTHTDKKLGENIASALYWIHPKEHWLSMGMGEPPAA